jgi:molecular chaperone GrpE (heat shock protein)
VNDQTKAEEIQDAVEEPEVAGNDPDGVTEVEAGTAVAEPPTVEQQLAAAQAEAEDYKDRWMRSQAEFANARKRMEKQRLDAYGNATANVIDKLLPIVDDFDGRWKICPQKFRATAGWKASSWCSANFWQRWTHLMSPPLKPLGSRLIQTCMKPSPRK